jgi:NhaP-type Na+/H+ or K+/H+ antiporter
MVMEEGVSIIYQLIMLGVGLGCALGILITIAWAWMLTELTASRKRRMMLLQKSVCWKCRPEVHKYFEYW